jgi:hypothetical protein
VAAAPAAAQRRGGGQQAAALAVHTSGACAQPGRRSDRRSSGARRLTRIGCAQPPAASPPADSMARAACAPLLTSCAPGVTKRR